MQGYLGDYLEDFFCWKLQPSLTLAGSFTFLKQSFFAWPSFLPSSSSTNILCTSVDPRKGNSKMWRKIFCTKKRWWIKLTFFGWNFSWFYGFWLEKVLLWEFSIHVGDQGHKEWDRCWRDAKKPHKLVVNSCAFGTLAEQRCICLSPNTVSELIRKCVFDVLMSSANLALRWQWYIHSSQMQ